MTDLHSEGKRCCTCSIWKPLTDFAANPSTADGRGAKCKSCHRVYLRERRDADPVGVWAGGAVGGAKVRASARGLAFALTVPFLISVAPNFCPVLGLELDYLAGAGRGGSPNTPTVDRIVPESGYVPSNVIVVSRRANTVRNDATAEELRAVTSFYHRLLHQQSSQ